MSAYRDSLSPAARARYDEATAAAGALLARALADLSGLAAAEGSIAVGRQAWYPGHPLGTPEAIAARWDELVAESWARDAARETERAA